MVRLIGVLLIVLIAVVILIGSVRVEARSLGATFTVTNTNGSGAGSLRQAIADANNTPGADIIRIATTGTVHLTSTLYITDDVTILGSGADRFAVDGGSSVQVFNIGDVVGGGTVYVYTQLSMADVTVQNGHNEEGNGGAIGGLGSLTLTNVSLLNNTAQNGGGVDVSGDVILNGGRFENNQCLIFQCEGGGLRTWGSLILSGTQLVNNTAIGSGGGAAALYARVNGGRFENNHCAGVFPYLCNGGGLAAGINSILTGTQFVSNTANGDGGGLWVYGATQLSGVRFENNHCALSSNVCFGGGMYAHTTASLTDTQFVRNTAIDGRGGGLSLGDMAQINGGRFAGNSASYGGGLSAIQGVSLTKTLFVSNSALSDGGGLYFSSQTPAGIASTLNQVQLLHNTAGRRGGGVYLYGGLNAVNTLFAANAALSGTALYLGFAGMGGNVDIRHITIGSSVPVTGAAIEVEAGRVNVINSIIANHSVGINRTDGTVTQDANLFVNNGVNMQGGVISGLIHPTGSPNFLNPALDDYRLGPGSAAIDQVGFAGVLVDFEGDVRPHGLRYDIGFDEYTLRAIYLPLIER